MQVQSLALLSGLRMRGCRELWCWSQMQLRSGVAMVAVAWASNYSSDSTPILGNSICHECGPKNKLKKKSPHVTVNPLCHAVLPPQLSACESEL